MKAVIQRVRESSVTVENQVISRIGQGYLILLGIEKGDTQADSVTLTRKIANLRIFADDEDKMNLSILNVKGSILLVSQFTLCALTRHGNRPAFTEAMPPEEANRMYEEFGKMLEVQGIPVQYGQFGAMMDVALVNDGPVTILLESRDGAIVR
ncbi:MAG: D-tyrosyl-tRNA(Tyr) deacylase [Proteobacteria bacterium]|nr:D-tyrosyl-tRNA(Tyr) deacylase [Pseudomonadota bacterium]